MAIVDGEITALGPCRHILSGGWLGHVEDDGDTILIIIALYALMRIGCIRGDQSMSL